MSIVGFVNAALEVAGKVRELIGGFDKKVVMAVVATLLAVGVIASGGYVFVAHRHASASSGSVRVGGLDMAQYCASYGYQTNDEDFCSSDISMDAACAWQYGDAHLHARFSSDVYSGTCYTAHGKARGGISDMPGYCQATFKGSADVQASVVGKGSARKWVCRTRLVKNIACNWQYQKEGLEAREEGGIWYCYALSNPKTSVSNS